MSLMHVCMHACPIAISIYTNRLELSRCIIIVVDCVGFVSPRWIREIVDF